MAGWTHARRLRLLASQLHENKNEAVTAEDEQEGDADITLQVEGMDQLGWFRRQDREKRSHPAVDVLVEVPLGQVLVSLLGGTVHAAHRSSLEQKYNESVRGYEE